MSRRLWFAALIIALAVTAYPALASPKDDAQGALLAAEAAVLKGDDKEALRQLRLYRKAVNRLRLEKRIKKATEELKKLDLPKLQDV